MKPPTLGILTNHPFSAHLIQHLHRQSVPLAVAAFHQHDLVAGAVAQSCRTLTVDQLVPESSWQDQLAGWITQNHLHAVFVLSFPHRIPAAILQLPAAGFWNFHPGPLPQYRGADPVFWLLANGTRQGALTVHRMDPQFDTGPVFRQIPLPISPLDTHGTHLDAVGRAAPAIAADLLHAFATQSPQSISLQPQPPSPAKPWPRPGQADTCFHWADFTASQIARLARAANPSHGGAKFLYQGEPTQLFDASPLPETTSAPPGTFSLLNPHSLTVACAQQSQLQLLTVGTSQGFFHAPHWFAIANP